jgi:hypothetical protein
MSLFFFKLGWSMWLIGVGVSVLILILHWTHVIQAAHFPWRSFLLTFGVGGFAPLLLGGVFAIWEAD